MLGAKKWLVLGWFFGIVNIFNGGVNAAENAAVTLPDSELQRLRTVISQVKRYYYRNVETRDLLRRAIQGMLTSLDPHSDYLEGEGLQDLNMDTLGKFGGIGVEIVPDREALKVVAPLDGTPAARAGIRSGDYVLQINHKLVRDLTLKEAVGMMRGRPGSKLSLTLVREGVAKPWVVRLQREVIKIESVTGKLLAPGYGYIRLALFQEPTEQDLVRMLRSLEQQSGKGGLQGLVLDLRNNPGGLLESAIRIADDFLDGDVLRGDKLIVYTQGQVEEVRIVARASAGDLLRGRPLVVLINGGSASASEIVAGALQDHHRAIIVGTRSFGKGLVQTVIPLDNDSAIKLTTATYYTPRGRSIQEQGIEPDINVEQLVISRDQDRNLAIPRVDESTLMDRATHKGPPANRSATARAHVAQRSLLELARRDYQLYEALHILQTQRIVDQSKAG